ncbi:MAG: hypothetical protein PF904_10255 [Kiritimatiellae bacterium]|jgi:hypothetical protein|nr:hypothetical protein [Kiritimatiellia bacterium]
MKLKKSSVDQTVEEDQEGTFISERFRNPADEVNSHTGSGNDTLFGIIAILATVAMIVVTVVLYFNWDAIKAV